MTKHMAKRMVIGMAIIGWIGLALSGCAGEPKVETSQAASEAGPTADPPPVLVKSGAQMWSENCARCHNYRDPQSYSDAEWAVAMHHMRVRGHLLPDEHKKILEFLQASN